MDHPYMSPQTIAQIRERMRVAGVREEDLEERFVLGSGAGGQKVNKTSSAVSLRHVPSGLAVKVQASRSREVNRWMARRTLAERLLAKVAGIITSRQIPHSPERNESATSISSGLTLRAPHQAVRVLRGCRQWTRRYCAFYGVCSHRALYPWRHGMPRLALNGQHRAFDKTRRRVSWRSGGWLIHSHTGLETAFREHGFLLRSS